MTCVNSSHIHGTRNQNKQLWLLMWKPSCYYCYWWCLCWTWILQKASTGWVRKNSYFQVGLDYSLAETVWSLFLFDFPQGRLDLLINPAQLRFTGHEQMIVLAKSVHVADAIENMVLDDRPQVWKQIHKILNCLSIWMNLTVTNLLCWPSFALSFFHPTILFILYCSFFYHLFCSRLVRYSLICFIDGMYWKLQMAQYPNRSWQGKEFVR